MPNSWTQWEGQTLHGKFPLLRYLGGSENSAVYLTERLEGDRKVNAAIRIVQPESDEIENRFSLWQEASKLSHPNLIQLYEIGRFELDGTPFIYAVMECADENLAQVLPSRALTGDEARATLESVLGALAYLHRKGFVHVHIKPSNIMAAGDQLKLSSDELWRNGEPRSEKPSADAYEAPESIPGAFPTAQLLSPAMDVWSLGITLVQTLTQDSPVLRSAERKDPLVPETLPQPFRDIATHCLVMHPQNRWTLDQIAARLEGRMPVELKPAPQAQTRPSASPAEPKIATPKVEIRQPAPVPAARPSTSRRPAKRRSYALPVALGFALVLIAIFVLPRFSRRSNLAEVPVSENATPSAPLAPAKPTPSKMQPPAKSAKAAPARNSDFDSAESMPKGPVATPAVIHPEAMRDETKNTVARTPAGSAVPGAVVHREMPEILQSASNSIHGTVRVCVKVNVDRSGNVEDAELASRGPSKYFARAAVQAAQGWKFKPPTVGGQGVLSSWILQFDFIRGQTTVTPTQEMP